jgi:hypothetical protein
LGPDYLRPEEEQWLKWHDGGEERFLANRGINIEIDDDREEGRAILRDIIAGNLEVLELDSLTWLPT